MTPFVRGYNNSFPCSEKNIRISGSEFLHTVPKVTQTFEPAFAESTISMCVVSVLDLWYKNNPARYCCFPSSRYRLCEGILLGQCIWRSEEQHRFHCEYWTIKRTLIKIIKNKNNTNSFIQKDFYSKSNAIQNMYIKCLDKLYDIFDD